MVTETKVIADLFDFVITLLISMRAVILFFYIHVKYEGTPRLISRADYKDKVHLTPRRQSLLWDGKQGIQYHQLCQQYLRKSYQVNMCFRLGWRESSAWR